MAQTVNYHMEGQTDLSLSGAWRTKTYGAGAVPLASGVVYFGGGSDRVVSGLTTLNLALAFCSFTPAWNGHLGGSGTSATIAVNTNGGSAYPGHILNYSAGGGTAYITCGSGGIGIVKVNSEGGKLFLTGGTPNSIECSRGELDINDSVDLSGKTVNIYGGNVVIDYKADGTDPTVNIYGGNVTLKRASGTITINGGNVIMQVEKEANAAATLVLNNGFLDWRSGDLATAATIVGGGLTFANAIAPIDLSAATMTIGDVEVEAATGKGAKVKWPTSPTIVGAASWYQRQAGTNDVA